MLRQLLTFLAFIFLLASCSQSLEDRYTGTWKNVAEDNNNETITINKLDAENVFEVISSDDERMVGILKGEELHITEGEYIFKIVVDENEDLLIEGQKVGEKIK